MEHIPADDEVPVGVCPECESLIYAEDSETCGECGADWREAEPEDADPAQTFGSCCICEKEDKTVRNLLMLNAKVFVRGHGWGCVTCGLASHGATAVVCDACLLDCQRAQRSVEDQLKYACKGYPGSEGRMPIAMLLGEHGHDWSKHAECPQIPPLIVAETDKRFPSHVEEGQGCHCSRCGETIWAGTVAIRVFSATSHWQYRYHFTCFGGLPADEDPYEEEAYGDNDSYAP